MSKEKEIHIGYWQHIVQMSKSIKLPQVFRNPEEVKAKL